MGNRPLDEPGLTKKRLGNQGGRVTFEKHYLFCMKGQTALSPAFQAANMNQKNKMARNGIDYRLKASRYLVM